MTKLKLTYFDFHGGRGEPARLAMYIGGIEFEDHRITFSEWASLKPKMPFNSLPVLEADGKIITQSNTINRYVGKLAKLYPEDALQAALCDEVMDAVEDISVRVMSTSSIKDEEEKKKIRETLTDGPISSYLLRLENYLDGRGGIYFADNSLTVADLKVFVLLKHIESGKIDYIPTDLIEKKVPLLKKHLERVKTHPKIVEYYQKH